MTEFEPKIVAFLCNWCAYAGADLAGVSRMQYPASLRTIRVMCSGRVDPTFIVRAFKEGCDGVLVSGWHFGDCHYLEGNVHAEKKMRLTRRLLGLAGIGAERLQVAWVSSAEARRFADIAAEVTGSIRRQGKFDPAGHEAALAAAEMTLNDEIVRWVVGKEVPITRQGDVYGRKWDAARFESVMDAVLEREYQKNLILLAVRAGCASPREVSAKTGLELKKVSSLLADMEKTKLVEFKGMQACRPVFAAL